MILIRLLGLLFALLACAALCYGVILWARMWRDQPSGQLWPDSEQDLHVEHRQVKGIRLKIVTVQEKKS